MSKTKVLSILFLLVWVTGGAYLVNSIWSSIDEDKRIKTFEKKIIEQLKLIREAEVLFETSNGRFTDSWDELIAFLDTGTFFVIEKTETVIPLPYGADSIVVRYDTLDQISVSDTIFTPAIRKKMDFASLPYVPGIVPKTKFVLWADKITKAGLLVNAIEVRNPKPVNPNRDEDSEYETRKPLRFGSKISVTTAGNWE